MVRILIEYTSFDESITNEGDNTTVTRRVKPLRKAYVFNGLPEKKVQKLENILTNMTMSNEDKKEFNDDTTSTKRMKELKHSFPVYNITFYRLEMDRVLFERTVTQYEIPLGNIMEDIFVSYFGLAIHYPYSTEHWNSQNTHIQPSIPQMRTQNPFVFGGGFNSAMTRRPLPPHPPNFLPELPPNVMSFRFPSTSLDTNTLNNLADNINLKRDHPDDNDIERSHSGKRQRGDSPKDDNDEQINDIKPISPPSNTIIDKIPDDEEELEKWFYGGSNVPEEPDFNNPIVQGKDFNRCIAPLFGFNPDNCDCQKSDNDNNRDDDDGQDDE